MNLMQRMAVAMFFRKDSQARIAISVNQVGQVVGTPDNYEAYSKRGYQKNSMVFTCISKIATAAAGIEWNLYTKDREGKLTEVHDQMHPLLQLWNKPNPLQSRAQFLEALIAYLKLSGNSYIEANTGGGKVPLELWTVRPDLMKVIPNAQGYPGAYQLSSGGTTKRWNVDFVNMRSDICHMKTFNPLNLWYGQSPLQAAALAMEQNNEIQTWNLGLLLNSASPSGVMSMKASAQNPMGIVSEEQFKRLKEELREAYQGAKNSGKPMLLEGGLEWQSMGLSPKDMDFVKNKEVSAVDLCNILGVPGEMVGLGKKTFANYEEARASFYEETVLPTLDFVKGYLNTWLTPSFGPNLYLDYDKDDIEALEPKRNARMTSVNGIAFLKVNEKREACGYEAVEGWDVFLIPTSNQAVASPDDIQTGGNSGDGTDSGLNNDIHNLDPNGSEPNKKPDENNQNGTGKNPKDPKKPPASGDEKTKSQVAADEGDDETGGKAWKSINLLNQAERKQSAKRQNKRKKTLQIPFAKDLVTDLNDMTTKLVGAVNKDNPNLELILAHIASDAHKELAKTLARHIKYTCDDFGSMILDEAKTMDLPYESKANRRFDSFVSEYVKRRTATAITQIEGTTKKQMQRIIKAAVQAAHEEGTTNAELQSQLQDEFSNLSEGRARTIARTEVLMASENSKTAAVKSLQIPGMSKEWNTTIDDRTRDGDHGGADHLDADGQTVPLDEKFDLNNDVTMDGPGDPSAPADQVVNCRCVQTYTVSERNR